MTASTPLAVCGGCPARWQSRSLAHCGSCHLSFQNADLFDRHRLTQGQHGACEDPSSLPARRKGWLRSQLVDGVWREPARWVAA